MAEEERLSKILEELEGALVRRLLLLFQRPETFLDEVGALESVIDFRKKLAGKSSLCSGNGFSSFSDVIRG